MARVAAAGLGPNFFVIVTGKTNGAHQDIVSKLKSRGQTEVSSREQSDYLLVFCPIASRVGTDISEALEKIPGGKPIILVVMHHTFNPDQIVAPSRRQVDNQNVRFTVDCLFYEGKLLKCERNNVAWDEIQPLLSPPPSRARKSSGSKRLKVSGPKFFVIESGRTNGAHQGIVSKLTSRGQTQASPHEESDYLLVFCPIAETDISEALEKIPGGKPIILVVMHHTSNCKERVPPSSRQVENQNILTVDYLFYGGELLKCKRNDAAWGEIKKSLPRSRVRKSSGSKHLKVSKPKFFVIETGKTNGAHRDIVSKLTSRGQTEVSSREQSDYLLVFCPIASRVGTDISEALENIPGGKPIILVVMHHTFNPDQVVAPSRRQVVNPNVGLTVDYLFYEGKLLKCERNDTAWGEIQTFLGPPPSRVRKSSGSKRLKVSGPNFFVIETGRTNGAHQGIVSELTSKQTPVSSLEESDYLLVFCPIVSQDETDISEALEKIPGGKPIILVVMHHTSNPDQIVAPRQMKNPNVCLTVDYLFYEGKLLQCERNHTAWDEIQKFLKLPHSRVRKSSGNNHGCFSCFSATHD